MRKALTDEDLMPWGVHKGTPLGQVPPQYLCWLHEQPWIDSWPELAAYLRKNEDLLKEHRQDDPGSDEGFTSYDDYRSYRGF